MIMDKAENLIDATAFWITRPETGELRSCQLPVPSIDEVRVRTMNSGVRLGTERLVFRGQVASSEYVSMRAPFQEGEFPWPVKYGYSSCGVVEEGPPDLIDKIVFSLFPHQDIYVIPKSAVCPIPSDVPPERTVLAANMETALNALWDVAPCVGARIAVIGAGVVGCLAAYLCSRVLGTEVTLVDTNTDRRNIAEALGIKFGVDESNLRMDLVIHASGSSAGLETAIAAAGAEATIVELSWFGDKPSTVHLGAAFHSRRLRVVSSQVGSVGVLQRPRWTRKKRLALALRLLSDDVLDCLVEEESGFQDLPQTMKRLMAQPKTGLCHRVVYP